MLLGPMSQVAGRTVSISLWVILCAAILWGMLDYRSADPDILSYSAMHLATIGMAGVAMLCGTRALFGAPSRTWNAAFLVLALLPALLFGGKNLVLRREFGLGELATIALAVVAVARLRPLELPGLDASLRQGLRVLLANVVILVGFLIIAEGFSRLFLAGFDPAKRTENEHGSPFWLQFQPFLMFSTDGPMELRFRNARRLGEAEFGHVSTNNMGFRMAEPVRFDTTRPKAPGERVVLFTGGSAAWGAGATSNETTIAARMQAILNESQTTYRYVVISLSSVSWSAFQSMLALTLYGLNFDPDWIVAMDGYNDMACSGGGGVRGAVHSHTLEQYFRSYLYHNPNPPFYRGVLENQLIRASALYRVLTQQRHVPPPVTSTTRWEDVERSLAFYQLSYDRLFRFFSSPKIKVLTSSQPNKDLYRADLDLEPDQLNTIARRYAGADCRHVPHADVVRYFGPRLKQVSQEIAIRWKDQLDIRYLNMNDFVPEEPRLRNDLFWGSSNLHFVDKGQDLLARVYVRTILESDLPGTHAASPAAEKN